MILVGALLAATTGVVAASVIAMGLISLPIMLRYGYDKRLATGVIAASGTLAQIIPPSLVLIVLADQLGALGRRHVRGRAAAGPGAGRAVSAATCSRVTLITSARRAGAAAGGAHPARLGAGAARGASRWCRRWC
ncbi:MAG: TRAP transporter large permease subunit [Chromatiales bacterium]|nr:TRAP transporter large permease subunit [Chromatiales bacterium]